MANKCHNHYFCLFNYFRGGQLRANPIRGYKIDMAIFLDLSGGHVFGTFKFVMNIMVARLFVL